MEGGSLHDIIHTKKKIPLNFVQKISINQQIADACLFLHQSNIIHRDLKTKVRRLIIYNYIFKLFIERWCGARNRTFWSKCLEKRSSQKSATSVLPNQKIPSRQRQME